jgi:hypothetical protein
VPTATEDVKSYVQDLIEKRLVHEVHTSERKSYRGCRRRWHWVFQEYYYPRTTAKPLEFGVAFHNAMEVLYNPKTWRFDRTIVKNAAINTFVQTCEEQKKKYLQHVDEQYLTNEEAEIDYAERVELGKGMLEYYCSEVAPQYDEGWEPLKVEVEFIVPIQNPDTKEYLFCTCVRCRKTYREYLQNDPDLRNALGGDVQVDWNRTHDGESWYWEIRVGGEGAEWGAWQGLVVCLAGRIDLLAKDRHGHMWIVDWKTAARLARGDSSGQDRDEFLELDDQIGSYVMALRRKLKLNVRGFVYVELKKAFPEPPTQNKQRRLGRLFSVNQQQSVDYDTYLKTVMEQDAEAYEAGLYDEFLTYLQGAGERFHGRYQLVKTDEELEEIERNLFYEASEMTDPNLRIFPSAGRFNCGFCAFRQPCLEKNRQGDYEYMLETLFDKREKHYWTKELSTDKQGGE